MSALQRLVDSDLGYPSAWRSRSRVELFVMTCALTLQTASFRHRECFYHRLSFVARCIRQPLQHFLVIPDARLEIKDLLNQCNGSSIGGLLHLCLTSVRHLPPAACSTSGRANEALRHWLVARKAGPPPVAPTLPLNPAQLC